MLILSYFAAAVGPIFFFFIFVYLRNRKRFRYNSTAFWARQNETSLSKIQFDKFQKIPKPFNFLSEIESLQTTMQVISLSIELGLLNHIRNNPGITETQIEQYLDFSKRAVLASIEVLLASDVIKHLEIGFSLTERAKFYLLNDSPFFEPLPPPAIGKRFLKIAKSGVVKGAVKNWNKGKSSTPEKWALKQHEYSFPIGFAIYDLGIIKGENILDVAGGTGSVCIALALRDQSLKLEMIELPESISIAKKMISQYKLLDRIRCTGIDMFSNEWSINNDTILFTNIFHDWDNSRCQILAKKAFNALRPGGIILIQEALLNENTPGPLWTAHWSMAMAVMMEGKQFRHSQLKNILETVGFRDVKVQPLLGYYSTISGIKYE